MKKLIKWFSIFAVIGTAVGLAVAYFCKDSANDFDENDENLAEDEDFDLDADLKPTQREYVSLNKEGEQNSEEPTEEETSETKEN